jgi:hypothetical protein
MPKLITLAVSGRTMVDQNKSISLIELLQGLEVRSPVPNAPRPPRNLVVPKEWSIFTFWKPGPDDFGGQTFVQVVQVLWPDGTEFNRNEQRFQFEEGKKHTVIVNINGFPAGQEGEVEIKVWLEQNSRFVAEPHTWFVDVKHHFDQIIH